MRNSVQLLTRMEGRTHTSMAVKLMVTPTSLPLLSPGICRALLVGELQALSLVPTATLNRKMRSREVEEPPPMRSRRSWVDLFPLLLDH